MWDYLFMYISVMSILAIIVTTYDKYAAKFEKRRISEGMLLIISLIGGSIAMYLMMKLINHKTTKDKFMKGIPLIIALQALFGFFVYRVFHYFAFGG